MVFEDLTTDGFATVNKAIGLDVERYRLVLQKMARWHAATAVMLQEVAKQFSEITI